MLLCLPSIIHEGIESAAGEPPAKRRTALRGCVQVARSWRAAQSLAVMVCPRLAGRRGRAVRRILALWATARLAGRDRHTGLQSRQVQVRRERADKLAAG